jgi:hypothetical protein
MAGCVERSGHFRIDAIGPITDTLVGLRVTFDGTPTGWTALSPDVIHKLSEIALAGKLSPAQAPIASVYPSFLDRLPKKTADERRKLPGVVIGMRESEVLAGAWGEPLSRKIVKSSRGLREEWHYPHGNALIFEDGVLEGYKK